MPDDKVTAALDEIRERWDQVEHVVLKPEVVPEAGPPPDHMGDVPRLLAALDEVLKLASAARVELSFPPADCTNACIAEPCNCSGKSQDAGWSLDPDAVRRAISRTLLGEDVS